MRDEKGVSLIEVLVGMVLIALISIASLSYFSSALGGIGKQGNRRAALERARERLEQIMAGSYTQIVPSVDSSLPLNAQPKFWLSCGGSNCTRTNAYVPETVLVNNLLSRRIESTVQWKDDSSAGTTNTPDTLELGAKVWFTPNTASDDDYNRVYVKTLRTP